MHLNIIDRILMHIFRKYTYKIYDMGVKEGFNWHDNRYVNGGHCPPFAHQKYIIMRNVKLK